MSTFPGSPRVIKGAIIAIDLLSGPPNVIVFQYNPDTLTRTLSAQAAGGNGDRGEALRLKGPPQETIRLEIEIDATDQLEQGLPPTTILGIHPALAALETLLYPKSGVMIANEALAAAGIIEILPPEAPLTVLVLGAMRILPIRITEFSITEEAHDPLLNPIRAKVTLSLRVLTYQDLGLLSPGGALFMAHQISKEILAVMNLGSSLSAGISLSL
jgi:hypothetical protein